MIFNIRILLLVCLLPIGGLLNAQVDINKRQLEHEDYDHWTTVSGAQLSNDGNWVQYRLVKGESSTLKFRSTTQPTVFTIPFGTGSRFSDDSRFAVYRISPDPEVVKKLRKEKKPLPKTHLEILELKTGALTKIEDVRSFQLPRENSDWLAVLLNEKQDAKLKDQKSDVNDVYLVTEEGLKPAGEVARAKAAGKQAKNKSAQAEAGKEKKGAKSKDDKKKENEKKTADKKLKPKTKEAGYTLVLRNLNTGLERRFPNVTSYVFSKSGNLLTFATAVKSGANIKSAPQGDGVSVVELETGELTQIISGMGNYKNIAIDESGSQLAFLSDRNDDAKKPSWSLYHWKVGSKVAVKIAHEGDQGIPEGWWIASNAGLEFNEAGTRLYYSTAPKPQDDEDKDDEPKAKLDLWHWQDPQLQPQQLLRAAADRNRSFRAVFDIKAKKRIQLADELVPSVRIDEKQKSDWLIANSNERYRKMMSWDTQGYQDVYAISQKSGEKKLLMERARNRASLSPTGKYLVMWDAATRNWMTMAVPGGKLKNISDKIEHPLWNELHDSPSEPRAYGIAGWLEKDTGVLVYDRYDIWQLDPNGKSKPICLTNGEGRKQRQRLRYVRLDAEQRNISVTEPMLLSIFDEKTKGSGFTRLVRNGKDVSLNQLVLLDESLGNFAKAKDSDTVMFTRSTFRVSPDIWTSSLKMKKFQRISKANPQQNDYRWGTAELTRWKSNKGQELEGLIYKPDGFDPNKKYPLLVYFYERNSDNLHRYYAPAAGRSIINFSFYVSRGYVLFVPDIPYEIGFPGDSAYDAVVPGVKHVVNQGFIDESRIGMQGHSWGGYQTAYLVTKTDMFACAESGAPVSNMTSAYGGIRWGSGMSRMFQYEKTQSRIGATLWQDREKYILNSPVFQADKINTPLLILHNDQDGAVPWYQGIELFVALRRLERPAWLMNYNGEPHWVMKPENRLDFAKRMQQFFDHYLMGDPMPEWMANGIPAVDKGKKFGFEPAAVEESGSGEK